MRIVYVLTSLGMGGAERQVLALAERMAARSHHVSIIALRPVLKEQWPTALPVIHLNIRKNPISFLAGIAKALHFLHEFKPDLLHSHSFHANLFARLLKIFTPSIAVISTVHNIYEGGRLRMLSYRLTDRLTRRTVAVSQAAADRFVRLKVIPRSKCVVITNAIDLSEFVPHPTRRIATRATMSAGTDFIWLAAGRIVPAKDFPNLLRAFDIVRADQPDTQLWLAGEALNEELSPVKSFGVAGHKGFMDRVRWLGLRRDMPALFDAADAFVLSSAWEGMPLVVGEAMAMQKPVVATDVGGVRELVGDCGTLVPAKSPAALTDAMLELMRTPPEIRAEIGCTARARIQHHFNMDARAEEWDELYHSALNQSS
ncbi:MAG: glycosyltransferase [Terracidiphilus sp.]|jgi:glycosyltransferase involved in cell wall biosynthesis